MQFAVRGPTRALPAFKAAKTHRYAVKSQRKVMKTIAAVASPVATTTSAPGSKAAKPMDIVFISAEVAPWSKTGGLADVVGSLPVELAKRGHNVYSIAPRFDQFADSWDTSVKCEIDGESVGFFHTIKQGVHRVWIDHPAFLEKVWGPTGSKLYGAISGADYSDNPKRFGLFCKAALESMTALPFMPGEDAVIVANDWHAALIPVYLEDVYKPSGRFLNTPTALCVHNIAFQGRFWPETFGDLGLPEASRSRFSFEDGYPTVFDETCPADAEGRSPVIAAPGQRFAKLNWLRAGITACDKLLTVSPHYATEIASGPQLGVELDTLIKSKGVEGIVNGMDVADWNPALDKFLAFKYNAETVEAGKGHAKAALQREVGLPVTPSAPLFGFIGRLEEQKGVDILVAALDKLPKDSPVQVAILGTGKPALEAEVRNLSNRFPNVAVGVVEFNNSVAHLITAGADFMVVPSRFEPCGLIQLHAMAYGTVPLVSSTGGLVDTVKEGVTGFQMGAMDPDGLVEADAEGVAATMARAAEVFGTPAYAKMRDACISQDLSWALPAKKWEATLTELKFGESYASQAAQEKAAVPTPVAKLNNPGAFASAGAVKPADIAAAMAAPKLGAAAPPTSPAAVIAAAALKATGPKPSPTAYSTKVTADAAAKTTANDMPMPVDAATAAAKAKAAASPAGKAKAAAAAAPKTVASKAAATPAAPKTVAPKAAAPKTVASKAAAPVAAPKAAAPAAAAPKTTARAAPKKA
ncbi:putative Granule-bound starch synthase 1, chloroplastic/amyloplastic [Nannochloris sp. 'desiccata']|nr:putative Granule-bound starch synthase 1, chloroplastic/amyloplastic [Chlorella desiccata (nom. nud.)]